MNKYYQTWDYCARLPNWLQTKLQFACGKCTGHDWSETESGYSGAGMLDVWCRWCNFPSQVPISEMPNKEYLKDLFESDIRQ